MLVPLSHASNCFQFCPQCLCLGHTPPYLTPLQPTVDLTQDPNSLSLLMPGDLAVTTRVLRRSEQQVGGRG
jgi:hypothetical protein